MPTEIVSKYVQMFRVSGRTAAGPAGLGPEPKDKETIDWLYSILGILDNKAGALLAFDGLLLAAETLMYEKMSENAAWLQPLALALIGVTLIAALLCLFVAQVSYAFLGKIKLVDNPAKLDDYDNSAEIRELGEVIETRTHRLWLAWWLSVAAVLFFIALVIIVPIVVYVIGVLKGYL